MCHVTLPYWVSKWEVLIQTFWWSSLAKVKCQLQLSQIQRNKKNSIVLEFAHIARGYMYINTLKNSIMKKNKTKSLKSCEKGELKLKRWMVIKVNRWINLIDE